MLLLCCLFSKFISCFVGLPFFIILERGWTALHSHRPHSSSYTLQETGVCICLSVLCRTNTDQAFQSFIFTEGTITGHRARQWRGRTLDFGRGPGAWLARGRWRWRPKHQEISNPPPLPEESAKGPVANVANSFSIN